MSNEQDLFSFDLNESLYFEKGQEVSQMLNISLDPEISIQSFNEYVSIRGVIELHGEYERANINPEREEQVLDINDYQSRRYFEKIKNEDDHLTTFSHRFPVEISVPSYRVDNMNDIKVSVATFDYEIPEENQFKLFSTIEIHGISNEAGLSEDTNERIENETVEHKLEIPEDSFQFELKEELLPERKEEKSESIERESSVEETAQMTDENDEEAVEKDRWKYKQTQSFEEFFKGEDHDETVEASMTEDEMNDSVDDEVVQDNSEEDELVERKSNYLADLFSEANTEEEIKYEQMRICIVQDQDTLESISERYQIPKLQILKLNRLADDDISKGQLLTIPSKKVNK